jgi:hypothetical protein
MGLDGALPYEEMGGKLRVSLASSEQLQDLVNSPATELRDQRPTARSSCVLDIFDRPVMFFRRASS